MRYLSYSCLIVLTLWIGYSAQSQGPDSEFEKLERLVELARGYLESDSFAEALNAFQNADAIDLHEAPNYRALVGIAEAQCRLGEIELGRALLEDFRCMLAVDAGDIGCYLGPETKSGPGHPNPELTPTCYERMCGEIYLSYYENPTEAMLERIDAMSRDADRVEALCVDPAQEEPARNDSLRRP